MEVVGAGRMGGGEKPRRSGGTRGGRDQFNWEDVKADRHRENYIGASVKGRVGRWANAKDVDWWTRERGGGAGSAEAREAARAEAAAVRAREEALMDEALGLRPRSEATGANAQGLPPSEGRPSCAAAADKTAGGGVGRRRDSLSPEPRRHRRHRRRRHRDRDGGRVARRERSPGRPSEGDGSRREESPRQERGRSPRCDRDRSPRRERERSPATRARGRGGGSKRYEGRYGGGSPPQRY